MSRGSREAIKRELVERATGKGKEPTWEGQPTKLQLVKGLNFYTETVEVEKLHSYAIAWAKKFSPSHVDVISATPAWKFQTYGALMRIVCRGLQISKKHLKTIQDFVNGLEMPVVEEKTNSPKSRKKKNMSSENANYRNFCDSLDVAVEAKKFMEPKLKVDKAHSVGPVIETCERELASMKEDPEAYPEHMKKWFRAVLKIMHGGKMPEPSNDSSATVKKAAKPAKAPAEVKAVEPPKAAPAAKKTAAPKAAAKPAKVEPEAANDPNCPLTGKSHAFLFDTRYGRLVKLVAADKAGFKVIGKTIHGICEKSSKVALLKNFGDAMKPGASNADELEAWMGKCVKKGNPIPVSTRTAKEVLVLSAA